MKSHVSDGDVNPSPLFSIPANMGLPMSVPAARGRIRSPVASVSVSHHSNERTRMDTFAQINRYHVEMLGYFLDKLQNTPDGDGNLLDHSVVLYGSSMSNGNQHDHDPLPILVAGGGAGQVKGNRHLVFPAHTPMSNLMLSVLDKLGVHQDSFGDSTGLLEI